MLKSKRAISMIIAVVFILVTALMTGCGATKGGEKAETENTSQTTATEDKKRDELPPVELVYYTFWIGPTTDIPLVNEEMNKILKEKINATLKINAIDISSYDQKMNTIAASGEYFDIAFTAWWGNNYYKNIANGAFTDLTDLLPKHAPNLWKTVPSTLWNAARVKGKIYGAINYQIAIDNYGMTFDMEWLKNVKEKSGFDAGDLMKYKKLQDIEPILAAAKKANLICTPEISGFNVYPGFFKDMPPFWGYDSIGDAASVGWVKLDDNSLKVVDQYETQEYKDFIKLMNSWYKAGYIIKDIAVQKDAYTKYKYWPPYPVFVKTGQDKMQANTYGHEFKNMDLGITVATTARATATLMGISSKSKNPERALMYLDLMATDSKLFNLLANGIENKHYIKLNDGTVDFPQGIDAKSSTYHPDMAWALGNAFIGYIWKGVPLDANEGDLKLNESAVPSPILGFSFDSEPIKTELAACQAVLDEYIPTLGTGVSDPDIYLPQMLDKLKTAGVDKIIAEKQRQIDEWKKSK
jgi:ABC-type sugar transport system, periplasmic component